VVRCDNGLVRYMLAVAMHMRLSVASTVALSEAVAARTTTLQDEEKRGAWHDHYGRGD
jgi:hypothetical protein